MNLLPVALNVHDKRCLIVGGGSVAARKARVLLECGAKLHVVAPELCEELQPFLSQLEYSARGFEVDDVEDCDLIFACTNVAGLNAQIAEEAARRKVWCNIADDSDASTFHLAATVRRGEICIGITTNAGSPALAKNLKAEVENCIGDEYVALLELMSTHRESLKQRISDRRVRASLWRMILGSEVLDLLRSGEEREARKKIDELIEQMADR